MRAIGSRSVGTHQNFFRNFLVMGANAEGKAHILLLCWTLIIIFPFPSKFRFATPPAAKVRPEKKYIAACASLGLRAITFLSHYSKGTPGN